MWPDRVVRTAPDLRTSGLLPSFEAAVRQLAQMGVAAITTSCGFLALLQDELQAAVNVPVVTSSLLQLPALLAGEERVGVLTISASSLSSEHLLQAGVAPGRLDDVVMQGVDPEAEFVRAILGNHPQMDAAQAGRDVVAAAVALKKRAPQLRTVVLECTNMPPYSELIREITGLRVLSLSDSPALRQSLGLDVGDDARLRQ
jgi:aspartate/glutamate racemase